MPFAGTRTVATRSHRGLNCSTCKRTPFTHVLKCPFTDCRRVDRKKWVLNVASKRLGYAAREDVQDEDDDCDPEDTVPAAGSGGASDDVVFSFRMAEGTLLRFYSDDIEFVRKVADLSRFGELELPALFEVLSQYATNSDHPGLMVLTKDEFRSAVRELVPGASMLDSDDKYLLSFALNNFFFTFEREGTAVHIRELLCGLGILCSGSKSSKLAYVWPLFDGDGDAELNADELMQFFSAYLKAIFACAAQTMDMTSEAVRDAVESTATLATESLMAECAESSISFEVRTLHACSEDEAHSDAALTCALVTVVRRVLQSARLLADPVAGARRWAEVGHRECD